jgi:tRNA(Glu) U13 pseudouridine synthase TruD
MAIPFARRLIYMNAFQSYVFNCFASWRIKTFGCKLVEGDLIRSKDTGSVVSIDKRMLDTLQAKGVIALRDLLLPLPGQNTIMPSYMPDELIQKVEFNNLLR